MRLRIHSYYELYCSLSVFSSDLILCFCYFYCFTHSTKWLMSDTNLNKHLSWNVRHAESSDITISLLPEIEKRHVLLPRPLCWLSSFASLNLPLEALDSLLTLQPSAAVAPAWQFVLQVFRTLARLRYVPSCLGWMETSPWILIKPVTFMFLRCAARDSVLFSGQMNAVLWGWWFPLGGENHINITLTIQTAKNTD